VSRTELRAHPSKEPAKPEGRDSRGQREPTCSAGIQAQGTSTQLAKHLQEYRSIDSHSQRLQQSVRAPAPIQAQGNLNFRIPLAIPTVPATTPSQSEQRPFFIGRRFRDSNHSLLPHHARNPRDGTPASSDTRFENRPKKRIARSSAARWPIPPAAVGSSRPRRRRRRRFPRPRSRDTSLCRSQRSQRGTRRITTHRQEMAAVVEKAIGTNHRRNRFLAEIARPVSLFIRRLYATTGNRRQLVPASAPSRSYFISRRTWQISNEKRFPHPLLYHHQPPPPMLHPKCQNAASIGRTSYTPRNRRSRHLPVERALPFLTSVYKKGRRPVNGPQTKGEDCNANP